MTYPWLDDELSRLRGEYTQALAEWDRLKPNPNNLLDDISEPAASAMQAAMTAETAYNARRLELGLVP